MDDLGREGARHPQWAQAAKRRAGRVSQSTPARHTTANHELDLRSQDAMGQSSCDLLCAPERPVQMHSAARVRNSAWRLAKCGLPTKTNRIRREKIRQNSFLGGWHIWAKLRVCSIARNDSREIKFAIYLLLQWLLKLVTASDC
jgi:hypothetical protein